MPGEEPSRLYFNADWIFIILMATNLMTYGSAANFSYRNPIWMINIEHVKVECLAGTHKFTYQTNSKPKCFNWCDKPVGQFFFSCDKFFAPKTKKGANAQRVFYKLRTKRITTKPFKPG